MSQKLEITIAVVGIDIGKNSFHVVGHDDRGVIVLRQKWSRGQVEARFAKHITATGEAALRAKIPSKPRRRNLQRQRKEKGE